MTFLGQNQCQTPTTGPWPNYPSKKTVDMSDVLFDSLYDSELPNAKGCVQWKIELQLFGKGGSVIVVSVETRWEGSSPKANSGAGVGAGVAKDESGGVVGADVK